MKKFSTVTTGSVAESADGANVRMGGMVTGSKVIRTKKDDLMAFMQLEDLEGTIEVVIFPSVYTTCQHLLTDDRPVMVQGKVQQEEKGSKLLADSLIAMEEAESQWTAEVYFNIEVSRTDKEALSRLRDIVRRYPGDCAGYLSLKMAENVETIIAMSDEWRIQPGDDLGREVKALLGYASMETRCGEIKPAQNGYKPRNGYGARRSG